MRRIRALAGIALLLGPAACAGPARTTAAPVPVASTGPVLNPVPERTTTPARDAAPRPRRTSPAPRTAPQDTDTGTGTGTGSGNAGLDRFVAEVRRQLPGVALDRRDEEVEALGEQSCAGLEAGKSANAVAGELGEEDVTPVDARKLVTLAGATACPGRPKVGDRA